MSRLFEPGSRLPPANGADCRNGTPPARRRCRRIALYSHDTQGLGHLRRNLLIARSLCANGETPIILLLSGLREASAFAMPMGVDCVTLPSLGKSEDGLYYPRSLGVPMADLIKVRSQALDSVFRSFEPDALIVDKVPRGAFDELLPGLAELRAIGRTRTILGLREILDDPATVRREWEAGDYERVIRDYYDRVWIYGDRRVYDPIAEYRIAADIAERVRFTGYLNPKSLDPPAASLRRAPGAPHTALCVVGGGRDGVPLAEAFLDADLPGRGILVTGPLMPDEARRRLRGLAAMRPHLEIHGFVTDPCPLLERADAVIAMGGYNTVCELLASRKPALIVPRVRPRTEQLIRATRFAELGCLDVLHPDQLCPAAIGAWLSRPPRSPVECAFDFGGVARLPRLLAELFEHPVPELADVRP